MGVKNILTHRDRILLKQESTRTQIKGVCDDGLECDCVFVCTSTSFVGQTADHMGNELKICTAIGFPNGYSTTAIKVPGTEDAIRNGADEIDMVINTGRVKDQRRDEVLTEIKAIKVSCQSRILKVIVETCLLTEAEKVKLCELATKSGTDYTRAPTGFSTGGAIREDMALFKIHISPGVKIRVADGISSLQDAGDSVTLGADRLGTSRIVKLVKSEHAEGY